MSETAVIVLGGEPIPRQALSEIPDDRWVVAADSGLDQAHQLGLPVDLLVGDLDSVSELALLAHRTTPRQIFPADKDATDFELAVDVVVANEGVHRLIVLGGHGGRLDHLLGNLAVLSAPRLSHLEVEWIAGNQRIQIIHHRARLHGHPGQTISLIPVSDRVSGVTTSGLHWELADSTLDRHSSRSISNRFAKPRATVSVTAGVLAAVQPMT